MTNKTLKIIAGFALVLSLATPALAVAPLVLTALELAATEIVLDNGIKFLMPESATPNMPKTGNATSTGVKRNLLARVGTTAALAVTGFMAYNEIKTLVNDNPTSYPNLKGAMYTNNVGSESRLVGSVVYTVNRQDQRNAWGSPVAYGLRYVGGGLWYEEVPNTAYGYTYATVVYGSTTQPYTETTVPDSQVAATLGIDNLYPQYQSEVDNLIRNNPDKIQLPPTIASDVANAAKQVVTDAQREASTARVDSLRSIRDAAQAAYDANPTPENKEALDKAEAELQEAIADDAALQEKQLNEDSVLPPPEPPEYDTINFQPLVDMGEELGDKFPFSLLATLKNFATGLVTTPRAPAFDITFPSPFNHTWHVSLDRFDGIAQMVRVLIGMAFLGYCTMAIIRRWQ